MTTLNLVVGANDDDATQNGIGNTASLAGGLTSDSTTRFIGARFQNVTIDQGDTINTAVFSATPTAAALDEPDHPFHAEDADNASAFVAATNNISNRTLTTAFVTWASTNLGADDFGTLYYSAPDMAAVVQEVIDRGGWSNGNALAIIGYGSASFSRDLAIYDYSIDSSKAAKLDIDYTAGGGGGGALPWLYRSFTTTLGAGFGGGVN